MSEEDESIKASQDDPLGDLLIAEGLGDLIRYDHSRSRWLYWDEEHRRWRVDATRHVFEMIRQSANRMHKAARQAKDPDAQKRILSLFNYGKKEAVLKSLSGRAGIAMTGNEWDRDPNILGFENGLLNLATGEFNYSPTPDLLVSKSVGFDWDPEATCPTFIEFIKSIQPDEGDGLQDYLLTLLGYSLFGLTSEQKFWMWVGKGSNGKGILARVMEDILGDYSETPSDTLYMQTRMGSTRSDAARPDLVRLQGARFTYMSEPPGRKFNDELLKEHTGEDMILARDLYSRANDMLQFRPTHTIVFLTNTAPSTDDVGISMRRRARVVRFETQFLGDRADFTLEDRIKGERQGILVLLARYAKFWKENGLWEPPKVTEWSADYIKTNNPLGTFVEDACVVGDSIQGPFRSIWDAYLHWCAQTRSESMSQTAFALALGVHYDKKRSSVGAVYLGIKAKSVVEQAESDE